MAANVGGSESWRRVVSAGLAGSALVLVAVVLYANLMGTDPVHVLRMHGATPRVLVRSLLVLVAVGAAVRALLRLPVQLDGHHLMVLLIAGVAPLATASAPAILSALQSPMDAIDAVRFYVAPTALALIPLLVVAVFGIRRTVSVADSMQTPRPWACVWLSGIAGVVAFALGVGVLRGPLGDIRYVLILLLGLLATVFAWCAAILSGSPSGPASGGVRWAASIVGIILPIIVVSLGR